MPCIPDLAAKYVWPELIKHPEFMPYVPDTWKPEGMLNRQFMWGVAVTVAPEYVHFIIKEAEAARDSHAVVEKINADSFAGISDQWIKLLNQEEFNPSKCVPD